MDTEAADFSVSVAPGDDALVTAAGDLDLAAASTFVTAIDSVFASHPSSVTLDLGAVTFLDSSGLGALLSLHVRCQSESVALTTINAPRQARRVLELTKLSDRFNLR